MNQEKRLPKEEELMSQLQDMASVSEQAQEILGAFVSGLFNDEEPTLRRTTWTDAEGDASDMSEQGVEARLKAAETRFKTLVEQIPALTFVAVLGAGKNEIYISPHIEQMLGFTQQEWLESPFLWYWQLHPDDREMWNQEFTRGCQTGGPFRAECRFYTRDGRIKWLHGEARLVKDELGRPQLLQGVAFDITESKRAQEVLVSEAMRKAKVEEELAIARRVQTSILPRKLEVEGLDIAATMVPANEVGGDYYDVLPFEGGAWIAVGDVSGHGLDSGLIMLMVQSAMAALSRSRADATPRDILVNLNAVLFDNIRARLAHDDHVTFSLLRYTKDGNVVFAGAHEDILVLRQGQSSVERIRTKGTWLGGKRDISAVTQDSNLTLAEGDLVVLYTDGITEAMDKDGEQFELDRLCDALLAARAGTAVQIRDALLAAVRAFAASQEDDQTLMVFRFGAAVEKTAPTPAAAPTAAASTGKRFAAVSSFDGKPSEPIPTLSLDGGPGRLSAKGASAGSKALVVLTGMAETPDRGALAQVLTALLEEHGKRRFTEVELDLRGLKFMASTCFKEMVTHLAKLQTRAAGDRYRIRFISDPFTRWQKSSLTALSNFASDIVVSEE